MGRDLSTALRRPSLGVGVLALALYLLTAPTNLTWRHGGMDGAELATAAFHMALPHPSGYPTYTLIAHLLTWLYPDPARVLTVMSAISAALAVALTAESAAHLADEASSDESSSRWLAALPVGVMAVTPLWWSQAIIAEVYAPLALLWAGLLWSAITGRGRLAATVIGLALTHHLLILWALPGVLWITQRRGLRLWRADVLLWAAPPLALWLLLPAMAQADALPWGDAFRENGLLWFVSGRYYAIFQFRLEVLADRLASLSQGATPIEWLGLSVVGIGVVASLRRYWGLGLAASGGGVLAYALTYGGPDTTAYLLLPLLTVPLFFAPLLAWLTARLPVVGRWVLAALIVALLGAYLMRGYEAVKLNEDVAVVSWLDQTVRHLPANSLLITQSDGHTFSAWYLQAVCGERRDVLVVDPALIDKAWFGTWLLRQAAGWQRVEVADLEAIKAAARRKGRPIFTALAPDDPRAVGGVWLIDDQGKVIDSASSAFSTKAAVTVPAPSSTRAAAGLCSGAAPRGK